MDTATVLPVVRQGGEGAAESDTTLRVELIQDYDAFVRLGPVWNHLVEQAGITHPFMRHEWIRTWWDCFEHGGSLHILVVKQGGEPIAIAPLMLDRGRVYGCAVRRLRGIANVYTERFDFILAQRPKEACQALWAYLAAESSHWDMLELRQIAEGARVQEYLPLFAFGDKFLLGQWPSSHGPYIPINQPWEAYVKSLSKKHLSNLRGRSKGLRRAGEVRHEIVTGGGELDRRLNEAFLLEAAAWKGQAGTAIMNRPDRRAFYQQLLTRAAEQGWLRLHFLTLNDVRIAVQIALQTDNRLYILKSGYDPHYAAYAPSLLLCELMLRDAWEQHLTEVDFLGDAERWKLDWAGHTRPHCWLFFFPDRPRTRLLHRLKFTVVPRLQHNAAYRMLRRGSTRLGLKVHDE